MRNVLAIVEKELRTYFVSPVAYVVMTCFLLLAGWFFCNLLIQLQQYISMAQSFQRYEMLEQLSISNAVVAPLVGNLCIILLFIVPIVTMRLLAEERKLKTDELLLTSPITIGEIIAGKFLGSWAFMALGLVGTLIYPYILFHYSNPDPGPLIAGYLGLVLITTTFVATGLFASSLTDSQAVAAVVATVINLGLFVIGWPAQSVSGVLGKVLEHLSLQTHFESLAKGVIETKDLAYFATVVFLFVFLAKRSLESTRYR